VTFIQLLEPFHFTEHTETVYTDCRLIELTFVGTNTEWDISTLIHATVFKIL